MTFAHKGLEPQLDTMKLGNFANLLDQEEPSIVKVPRFSTKSPFSYRFRSRCLVCPNCSR